MSKTRTSSKSVVLAKMISWIFYPLIITPLSFVLVLNLDGYSLPVAVAWSAFGVLLITLPIAVYLVHGIKRKKLVDADVSRREQRPRVFMFGMGCLLLSFGLLLWLGAPAIMLRMLAACFMTALVFTPLTKWVTKLSVHTGAMAGVAVVTAFYSGSWAAVWAVATVLVAWSRVTTQRHTWGEAVGGIAVASTIFWLTMLAQ